MMAVRANLPIAGYGDLYVRLAPDDTGEIRLGFADGLPWTLDVDESRNLRHALMSAERGARVNTRGVR